MIKVPLGLTTITLLGLLSSFACAKSSAGVVEDATSGGSQGDSEGDLGQESVGEEGGATHGGNGEADGDGDGDAGFELELFTYLDGPYFVVDTNLPPAVGECARVVGGQLDCLDEDQDGWVDLWEDLVLGRLQPVQRFDEEEGLFDDGTAVLGNVARLSSGPGDELRAYIMLGYSRDYGSCGISAHNGDSERVALKLAFDPAGQAGAVRVHGIYTAAHEGTVTDGGEVVLEDQMGTLSFTTEHDGGEPRWVVFPSANKHATYGTVDACENVSPLPCFDEDCAPDEVSDPLSYDRIPPMLNAGEPDAPRLTELGGLGFPGEEAWVDQDFCGGLGGSGCSSPVLEKLTIDPF